MGDYTSLGEGAFNTLEEAKEKCLQLPSDDCRGVTWIPNVGNEPRRGINGLQTSPSGEVTYIRPGKFDLIIKISCDIICEHC